MSIEDDIIAWALERPGWQQEVLVSLGNGEAFDDARISTLADVDAICVFCQQPLEDDARARMTRFDEFMRDTTERDAAAAEGVYRTALETILAAATRLPRRTWRCASSGNPACRGLND